MSTLLKKISAKNVCSDMTAPAPGVEKNLMVVMGFAKNYETKVTVYGDSIAFHGDFKAVDMSTGEEFRSGICYLPDVAEHLLKATLESTPGTVEFAFEIALIGVKPRTEGETGKYEYRCKPLMKSAENDPLQLLEERLKQGLLEAPKAQAQAKHADTPPPVANKKGGK